MPLLSPDIFEFPTLAEILPPHAACLETHFCPSTSGSNSFTSAPIRLHYHQIAYRQEFVRSHNIGASDHLPYSDILRSLISTSLVTLIGNTLDWSKSRSSRSACHFRLAFLLLQSPSDLHTSTYIADTSSLPVDNQLLQISTHNSIMTVIQANFSAPAQTIECNGLVSV